MAKIKNTDVSEKDVFKDLTASAEKAIKTLDGMEAILKSNLEIQKQLAKPLQAGNISDLKALSTAQKEVKKNIDGLNAVEKERINLEAKLKTLNSDKIQSNEVLKVQISEQRRINKELAKDTLKLTNAYTKLTKETNKAQAEFKRLAAEFGVNSKQAKAAKVEFDKLDDKLRKVNNAANDGRRDVGRYGLAWGGVGNLLKSGLGVLGITSAIGILGGVVKGAFDIVTGFEQAIAELSSVTGLSGDELDNLKNKVIEVSSATGKGATEIANAFKLVGSAQPELLKNADALAEVTKQAVILSKAGGLTVEVAADALTNSMNQFGVSAKDAANFVDILATSQQKGTAPINKLAESMTKAGGTARAFGLDFGQTNALIQGFAKGGVLGAEAGTQLSGVLAKLSKVANKDFNPSQTNAVKVIQNLKDANLSYTDLLKLTDAEGAKWLSTLINQNDIVQELNGNLLEHGNALKQAETNYDTAKGAGEKFKATWEEMILSIEDGNGTISNIFKGFINEMTEWVNVIINLNKTFTQKTLETTNKFTNTMIENGTRAASETKKMFTDMGFSGDVLAEKLINASKQAKEFGKQAKERGDAKLAISYFAEAVALTDMVKAMKNSNEEITKNTDITNKNNKAKKDAIKLDKYVVDKSFEGQDALDKENEAKLKAYEDQQKALEELRDAQRQYDIFLEKQNDEDRQKQADAFEEEQARKRQEIREKTLEVIETLEEKYFNERQKRADKEISDQEKREQQLQDLANQGVQDAKDSLAKNQKDQAEAEKKKEELIQQEEQFQLALAVYKAFNAELDKGASTGEALSKALVSTSVLTAAASSLPAFWDGADEVSESLGKPQMSGRDGYIVRVDGKEQVWSEKDRSEVGYRDRSELKSIVKDYDNGLLSYALNSNSMGVHYDSNSTIKKELNKLYDSNQQIVKAIENKEVDKGWELDDLKKVVSHTVRKGSSITKTNFKL